MTKRMKLELITRGQTETRKYVYRLNEKNAPRELPRVERIEKKYMGTTGYYTEWERVPVTYNELCAAYGM